MILPAGVRNLDKVFIGQPAGLAEDRAGNRNFLVPCELANELARRLSDRRQACAQLHQSPALDALYQMDQHIVENADLLLIETIRVVEKQVGYPAQSLNALFRGTSRYRFFKLEDQRR